MPPSSILKIRCRRITERGSRSDCAKTPDDFKRYHFISWKTQTTIYRTGLYRTSSSLVRPGWSFLIEKELGFRLGLVLPRPDIEAQKLCESICGNIYYPSTLDENLEVEHVLDDGVGFGHWFTDDVWIRIVFNRTEHKWKDAGNIETNIEYYFRNGDTDKGHVSMDGLGKWESRSWTESLSEYILCELSKTASIHQFTPDEFTTSTPLTTWSTTL